MSTMRRDPRETAEGAHYRTLTNNYVQWLGLEPFLYERPDPVAVWVSEHADKPRLMRGFDIVVVYNHTLYVRTEDGLAWEWIGT